MTQAEQAAKEYFETYFNTKDDGDYPGITVTYKLFVQQVKAAHIAGAAYQQEQDKEAIKELVEGLREIVEHHERLGQELTELWKLADEGKKWHFPPVHDKAKQLITKYSKP